MPKEKPVKIAVYQSTGFGGIKRVGSILRVVTPCEVTMPIDETRNTRFETRDVRIVPLQENNQPPDYLVTDVSGEDSIILGFGDAHPTDLRS